MKKTSFRSHWRLFAGCQERAGLFYSTHSSLTCKRLHAVGNFWKWMRAVVTLFLLFCWECMCVRAYVCLWVYRYLCVYIYTSFIICKKTKRKEMLKKTFPYMTSMHGFTWLWSNSTNMNHKWFSRNKYDGWYFLKWSHSDLIFKRNQKHKQTKINQFQNTVIM